MAGKALWEGLMALADTATKGIRAYHSSPHDFERFDFNKIGTGEGAQVYGHGGYFAENPKVSGQGGQYWRNFSDRFSAPENEASRFLSNHNFDRAAALAEATDVAKYYRERATKEPLQANNWNMRAGMIERARDVLASKQPIIGPRTYEVNINAAPGQFLQWDYPLSAMSPSVQEAMMPFATERADRANAARQRMLSGQSARTLRPSEIAQYSKTQEPGDWTGEKLYDMLQVDAGAQRRGERAAEASAYLRDRGIPGIRYLDEGSRPALSVSPELRATVPNPTYNYVVNDDRLIDIAKKYGVVGAPLAPALFGGNQQDMQ